MEITFLLIYIFLITILICVGYLYKSIAILAVTSAILILLGLNVISVGYEVQSSFNQYSDFNYTYFANSQTNEVTGFNLTKSVTFLPIKTEQTTYLGVGTLALGLIIFFLGLKYR